MNNLPLKKLAIYFLLLIVGIELVWGIVYLSAGGGNKTSTQPLVATQTTGPVIEVYPKKAQLKVSTPQEIRISIDTNNKKISGVDMVLSYDPTTLQFTETGIKKGNVFQTFIKSRVDPVKKQVSISGVAEPNAAPFSGKGTFVILTVTPISKGTASLTPLFLSTNETIDSNLVEASTGKDILRMVSGGVFEIN